MANQLVDTGTDHHFSLDFDHRPVLVYQWQDAGTDGRDFVTNLRMCNILI